MKTFLIFSLSIITAAAIAQSSPLSIPDTLVGTNFNLSMHKDSVQFFAGKISHTHGFNSNKYLGPTLIFNKGTNVNITVNNQVGDTTSVHWHGLHVPSKWDGGPHTPLLPSASWSPSFTVMDHAATYWYHPHPHKKTAAQAIKGAAGLIIVRDPIESALILPRKYGVDDFPVIVQVQQYDSLNQAMPLGMQDSTILVNGTRANYGYTVFANMPAQVIRMRLLNASGERVLNFGFSGNKQFYQIASDGGLLNSPFLTTRVRLAPGERAEILLDLTGMNGQTLYLMSYASELPMGVQGGPTMPMPGGPPMNSPLNGVNFNVMQLNIVAQTINPVTSIPSSLTVNTPYLPGQANITRTIRFTADNAMVMDGPFYFNDSTYNMMRIDYDIPLNNIEIWKLVNETMVAHPFHIHDVQFYVIDRNGNPPTAEEAGRKDVVLVPPGDSLMFITKFEDFTDTIIPYMYHCHILMHEDDGMMGQFVVKAPAVGINELSAINGGFLIYPNPTSNIINIKFKDASLESAQIQIMDCTGRMVYSEKLSSPHVIINTSKFSEGLYSVLILKNDRNYSGKIVIQR
ncbi:MAG: multicopper oxidase domain-containing protein [Bacteroidia bacterium]